MAHMSSVAPIAARIWLPSARSSSAAGSSPRLVSDITAQYRAMSSCIRAPVARAASAARRITAECVTSSHSIIDRVTTGI